MADTTQYRLVVIEDNAADVFLIQEAIRSHRLDCECIVFDSFEEAMQGIETGRLLNISGMLIDLNLRTGSGLDILSALRSSDTLRTTPIAILTSSDSPRDKQLAFRLGTDLYVRKPTGLDEFLRDVGGAVMSLFGQTRQSASNSPR
jgi:two-component system, chemotaxis family, response regulator Rcp1